MITPISLLMLIVMTATGVLDSYFGEVIGVDTGNAFTISEQKSKTRRHIRLKGIDSPMLKYASGREAKSFLKELIYFNWVLIEEHDELNGIIYGHVFVEIDEEWVDVNKEMIRQGLAWNNNPNNEELNRLEHQAKKSKKGIWKFKTDEL